MRSIITLGVAALAAPFLAVSSTPASAAPVGDYGRKCIEAVYSIPDGLWYCDTEVQDFEGAAWVDPGYDWWGVDADAAEARCNTWCEGAEEECQAIEGGGLPD